MKISNLSHLPIANKNSKQTMFTSVILVCVHDLQDDIIVNHSLLYSIFSNYGEVLRILIFERSNTLKAFLEYTTPQSAVLAKKNLNRALLFQGRCRMSIYPSNLQTIKFQNNYPGGVDYTLTGPPFSYPNKNFFPENLPSGMQKSPFSPRSPNNYYENGSSRSSSSNNHSTNEEDEANGEEILQMINRHHQENKEYDFDGKDYFCENEEKEEDDYNNVFQGNFCKNTSFGTFQKDFLNLNFSDERMKSCPQNSSSFSNLKLSTRLPCFPQTHSEVATSFEYNPLSNRSFGSAISEPPISRFYSMDEIPSGFENHEDRLFQPLHKFSPTRKMENFGIHSEYKENVNQNIIPEKTKSQKTEARAHGKEEGEKQSPVLHVLGIENKEVTTKMLFNIFSSFGNIVKLIFIKTRAVALVEFENMSSAALAKEHLHNVAFFGKPLRITYSKYPKIQLQPGQGEKYPEQLIIGEEKLFRFKQGKNIVIAPPSCTLHVSNLTKESCKDKKAISDLFGKYGEVKAVKSLFGENGKNMCLIKMKSMEECLKVMAQLHDTEFGGRKLQISFSRSKI